MGPTGLRQLQNPHVARAMPAPFEPLASALEVFGNVACGVVGAGRISQGDHGRKSAVTAALAVFIVESGRGYNALAHALEAGF